MSSKNEIQDSDSIHRALIGICEGLSLNREELADILKVCPKSFFNPSKQQRFDETEKTKVMNFINFYVELTLAIPYQKNQSEWFRTPNVKLENLSPLEVLVSRSGKTDELINILRTIGE
jgi:hypothetical protein